MKNLRNQKGTAQIVEFAFMLIFTCPFFFATLQIMGFFGQQHALYQAAKSGARKAVTSANPMSSAAAIKTEVEDEIKRVLRDNKISQPLIDSVFANANAVSLVVPADPSEPVAVSITAPSMVFGLDVIPGMNQMKVTASAFRFDHADLKGVPPSS